MYSHTTHGLKPSDRPEEETLPSPGKGTVKPEAVDPIRSLHPRESKRLFPELPILMVLLNDSEPRKGNALAISALVLGIIAALICWVPFLGLLSIPVGLLGMLLGLIGLALALIGRRSGLAPSLVGTGISLAIRSCSPGSSRGPLPRRFRIRSKNNEVKKRRSQSLSLLRSIRCSQPPTKLKLNKAANP